MSTTSPSSCIGSEWLSTDAKAGDAAPSTGRSCPCYRSVKFDLRDIQRHSVSDLAGAIVPNKIPAVCEGPQVALYRILVLVEHVAALGERESVVLRDELQHAQ